MSPFLIALGSFLITSAMWIVIMINMANNWETRVKILKAQRFGLEQQIIHLMEGRDTPHWQTRQGGVDDMVTRGRPDVYQRDSIIDLTDTGDTPE